MDAHVFVQVNYEKYSDAPWMLPMGGLLSINSGCANLDNDHVQIMRLSTLEVGALDPRLIRLQIRCAYVVA